MSSTGHVDSLLVLAVVLPPFIASGFSGLWGLRGGWSRSRETSALGRAGHLVVRLRRTSASQKTRAADAVQVTEKSSLLSGLESSESHSS